MQTRRTVFARTLCLCRGARCSLSQQSRRTQCAPAGDCPQNQRRNPQPQRLTDPHGTRQSFWHLDGSGSQSVPPVSRSAHLHIFLMLSVNIFALLVMWSFSTAWKVFETLQYCL